MALGFGTTFGTNATTDRRVIETTARPTIYTLMIWAYRNGEGASNAGRMFDDNGITLLNNLTGTVYQFTHIWTPTGATWTAPRPTATAWHPVIIRYDGSSASNDPLIDYETPQTVTEVTAPSTTISTSSVQRVLGNRAGFDRAWDGMLAEYAMWHRILTDGEVVGLAKGFSPLFYRRSLVRYRTLIRHDANGRTPDIVGGDLGGTDGDTGSQPHPPIIYPRGALVPGIGGVPPAGGGTAFRRYGNVLGTRTGTRQAVEA